MPGNLDAPGDGVDANCDRVEWCYDDADGDGARTTTLVLSDVAWAGAAFAAAPYDCDDLDVLANHDDLDADGASTCDADPDDADGGLMTDGDFFVSSPDVPVASRLATLRIEGATPGSELRLVTGSEGGTTTWPGCARTMPLGSARLLQNRATVAGDGTALIERRLPEIGQRGAPLAVDPATCEVSNAVGFQVYDE